MRVSVPRELGSGRERRQLRDLRTAGRLLPGRQRRQRVHARRRGRRLAGNGQPAERHRIRCSAASRRAIRSCSSRATRATRTSAAATGITVQLANVSEVTGQPEYIRSRRPKLRNGGLLYVIGVAPRNEAGTYDTAFRKSSTRTSRSRIAKGNSQHPELGVCLAHDPATGRGKT